mgnify:FL=1
MVKPHWKYRLRLAGVPLLARLGRCAGLSWDRLGRKLGREVLLAQVPRIDRNHVPAERRADKPLDVVCMTMMGGNHRLAGVEVVLGLALRARGHRVRYVLCDRQLDCCEVKWQGREPAWPAACAKCHAFGRRLLGATGCEVLNVSDLIAGRPLEGEHEEYVESALLKHYHVGVLEEDAAVRARRERFLQAARVSAAVGRALAELRPDRVIMSHGIYCTWGPAREALLAASVPVVTYGEGKKRDTEKFNWNTSADWWDVSAEWDKVRDTPLTPAQQKTIDDYLASRRSHSQDARVYNFGQEESLAQTRQRLRLEDKPTFVLFTNVLWDAASAQREIAFSNPVQWVLDTIAWFDAHRDRQLVVKIHPAEVVIGTNQPFASLIARHFPTLPPNVRVIEPAEKVNSWSILRVANLGIVHTSTVGMELPLEGVPCMVVSRTHFRGRGFTVDVESRDEYFRTLETWDPARVDRAALIELATRYAYLLFERYQLPFPFLRESSVNDVRSLAGCDASELLDHPTIRVFLRGIEQRGEFLLEAT